MPTNRTPPVEGTCASEAAYSIDRWMSDSRVCRELMAFGGGAVVAERIRAIRVGRPIPWDSYDALNVAIRLLDVPALHLAVLRCEADARGGDEQAARVWIEEARARMSEALKGMVN